MKLHSDSPPVFPPPSEMCVEDLNECALRVGAQLVNQLRAVPKFQLSIPFVAEYARVGCLDCTGIEASRSNYDTSKTTNCFSGGFLDCRSNGRSASREVL